MESELLDSIDSRESVDSIRKGLSETGLFIQVSNSLFKRDEIHFSIGNCYDEIIKGAFIMEKNHRIVIMSC